MPVAREWQAAIGLQDCMVVSGTVLRVDIPEFEPSPHLLRHHVQRCRDPLAPPAL